MALHQFSSLPISAGNFISKPREFTGPILNIARLRRGTNPSVLSNASRSVKCIVQERVSEGKDIIARRSANYQPPIWHFNFVQSLKSEYVQVILLFLELYLTIVLMVFSSTIRIKLYICNICRSRVEHLRNTSRT